MCILLFYFYQVFGMTHYQETDFVTGEQGYNLAAILLFGKDEVIQSCVPGYVTDALCRKENMDRYDDRLIVKTNLIESYEKKEDNWVCALCEKEFQTQETLENHIKNLHNDKVEGVVLDVEDGELYEV